MMLASKNTSACLLSMALFAASLDGWTASVAAEKTTVDFESQIQPILAEHCYACHGPEKQKSKLRLDAPDHILKGGDSGEPVLQPGHSAASHLIKLVTGADPDEVMPPKGERVSPDQIALLKAWIDQGAKMPGADPGAASKPTTDHWSFQPVKRPVVPPTSDAFVANEIDAFILDRLNQNGLKPSARAARKTLIRRLYLDLHGLPPTTEAVDTFVQSEDPLAYAHLVDELLASPRYGERWAQYWLDIVRYADTDGYEVNTPRAQAWPYRDYVIRAFNEDKPYDRFIVEQLAGDTVGENAATGFLVAAAALLPGQIGQDEESKRLARQDALDEIIVGTCETFLGLTLGCARCHDHKFDPLTQKDYYAMQAFFAGVEYGERPLDDAASRERRRQAEAMDARLTALTNQIHGILAEQTSDANDAHPPSRFRPPVNAGRNEEAFPARPARFVRFTSLETDHDNQYEPCLDELEVFAAGSNTNVALASLGVVPSSSGNYTAPGQHELKHINDGQYGNERSWISDTKGRGWVQLTWKEPVTVDRVVWGRDRQGKFKDRLAIRYRIEIALEPDHWETVASSDDREPYNGFPNPIAALLAKLPPEASPALRASVEELKELHQRQTSLEKETMVFAGTFRAPDETHILRRGDPEQPGERIEPAVMRVLGGLSLSAECAEKERRLSLARWIARPDHPLTARILVNRIWQYHFGQGLVDTPSDFGHNGSRPSHLELLDWLATTFLRDGWSIKRLHRRILLSQTYQQSNLGNAQARAVDADDRLLWRFPSRRLEAEAIRDSMLQVTGRLNLTMGGPGFDFFKSRGGLNGFPPVETFGPDKLRRMIYAHKVRMEPVPVFGAFDCPDAGRAAPRRRQSTTAIQALNLFNSPFVAEQATAFAARVELETGTTASASTKVEEAFRLALGRGPSNTERAAAEQAVADHGLPTLCRALYNCNEFLFLP